MVYCVHQEVTSAYCTTHSEHFLENSIRSNTVSTSSHFYATKQPSSILDSSSSVRYFYAFYRAAIVHELFISLYSQQPREPPCYRIYFSNIVFVLRVTIREKLAAYLQRMIKYRTKILNIKSKFPREDSPNLES